MVADGCLVPARRAREFPASSHLSSEEKVLRPHLWMPFGHPILTQIKLSDPLIEDGWDKTLLSSTPRHRQREWTCPAARQGHGEDAQADSHIPQAFHRTW